MAALDDLLDRLGDLLTHATAIGYDQSSALNDVYEGVTWAVALRGARAAPGWQVAYANASGGSFKFRLAPGNIYSSTAFSYAVASHPSAPSVEIHLGVRVKGASGVSHEFDVLILTKDGADAARAAGVDPNPWDVLLHAECKYYQSELSLPVARSLVGLSADCLLPRKAHMITRHGASVNVRKLMRAHDITYIYDFFPQTGAEALLENCVKFALKRFADASAAGSI